jgi:hypothetical protein
MARARGRANDTPPTAPTHTAHTPTFHEHVQALQGQRITDQGHYESTSVGLVHFDGQGRVLIEEK